MALLAMDPSPQNRRTSTKVGTQVFTSTYLRYFMTNVGAHEAELLRSTAIFARSFLHSRYLTVLYIMNCFVIFFLFFTPLQDLYIKYRIIEFVLVRELQVEGTPTILFLFSTIFLTINLHYSLISGILISVFFVSLRSLFFLFSFFFILVSIARQFLMYYYNSYTYLCVFQPTTSHEKTFNTPIFV